MPSHHLTPTNGGAHWVRTPLTTRISQTSILLVSLTWGASYCMPPKSRVPFSEVFPPALAEHATIPMWGWGMAMLVFAVGALLGEQLILRSVVAHRDPSRFGWHMSIYSHIALAGIYFTLLAAAALTGFDQAGDTVYGWISALSRPVLWGYIAVMHVTYSRLPSPFPPNHKPKKGKIRLLSREAVNPDGTD